MWTFQQAVVMLCIRNEHNIKVLPPGMYQDLRLMLAGDPSPLGSVYNNKLQPVVFLEVGTLDSLIAVGRLLDAGGVIAGYRAYPVVSEDQCGLRFAITAGHERAHIDQVLSILSAAKASGLLRQRADAAPSALRA